MTMPSRRECLIALNCVPAAPAVWRRLVEALGSWDAVWAASVPELRQAGLTVAQIERLTAARAGTQARDELARATRQGIELITLDDAGYPARLRTLADPPPVLYVQGTAPAEEPAVAIVGARHASLYGVECAERLASDLAACGVTVVSGLARGIDAAAHRGALRAGGRTVAVLGSGLDRVYPPEHAELAAQVAARGALVSEFPFGTPPVSHNFPRRNRVISGLALGVVVVEAGHRSGALITADCALEQGNEVFAVPGPMRSPTSQGTHALLKQGARLVTGAEDILEELGLMALEGGSARARAAAGTSPDRPDGGAAESLDEPDRRVMRSVPAREARGVDAIAAACRLPASQVAAALLRLELRRLVRQLPGMQFVRR